VEAKMVDAAALFIACQILTFGAVRILEAFSLI
jgi:hypothetical protein